MTTRKSKSWYLEGPCADCQKVDNCDPKATCQDWEEYQKMLSEIKEAEYWDASNEADASLIAHVNRRL